MIRLKASDLEHVISIKKFEFIQKYLEQFETDVISDLEYIEEDISNLKQDIIGDVIDIKSNLDRLTYNMKSIKEEILKEMNPIMNGLISENSNLKDEIAELINRNKRLQEDINKINKNILFFKDRLNILEDEPFDTNYDYVEMKKTKSELHKELKRIHKLFSKCISQTYAPIAICYPVKQV